MQRCRPAAEAIAAEHEDLLHVHRGHARSIGARRAQLARKGRLAPGELPCAPRTQATARASVTTRAAEIAAAVRASRVLEAGSALPWHPAAAAPDCSDGGGRTLRALAVWIPHMRGAPTCGREARERGRRGRREGRSTAGHSQRAYEYFAPHLVTVMVGRACAWFVVDLQDSQGGRVSSRCCLGGNTPGRSDFLG